MKKGANKSLGQRIRHLRELAGLSQEALAKDLGADHSFISNLENDKCSLKADKIIKLSQIFNITTDQLLGIEPIPEVVLPKDKKSERSKNDFRIEVPIRNLEKFKEALLYILDKIGAKPNIGETVLYKLLYFIDFNFYEKYEEQLIGATYIKNHHGPTPIEFKKIVDKMIKNGELVKVDSQHYTYNQKKYLPHRKPNLSIFNALEIKTIDEVLNKLSDMNAVAISNYSHKDVPWLVTAEGKKIDYETVFYRTPDYSVRDSENE